MYRAHYNRCITTLVSFHRGGLSVAVWLVCVVFSLWLLGYTPSYVLQALASCACIDSNENQRVHIFPNNKKTSQLSLAVQKFGRAAAAAAKKKRNHSAVLQSREGNTSGAYETNASVHGESSERNRSGSRSSSIFYILTHDCRSPSHTVLPHGNVSPSSFSQFA